MSTFRIDTTLPSPYPWFGGKRKAAPLVWGRFGNVANYVEPFFGSGAVLLARPHKPGIETINDADGFIANFWRAVQADPDAVAHYADWPVNEIDLHSRHAWLIARRESVEKMLADPEYFDAKVAGWWVWGLSCWIGSGWCAVESHRRPHLGDAGQGVNRKSVRGKLQEYIHALSQRLRHVRVCCGDWSQVCTPIVTVKHGITGVFLDPPYSGDTGRDPSLYAKDDLEVSASVRKWAIEWGEHPNMRIALCGYEGEHEMPPNWECVAWRAKRGCKKSRTAYTAATASASGSARIAARQHCFEVICAHTF